MPEIEDNPHARRVAAWRATAAANVLRNRQANEEALLGAKTPLVRAVLPSKRRGELAELAFLYKAAGLGFGVAKPYGDSEHYDFILDSGQRLWRVQVRSTSKNHNRRYEVHGNCGSYLNVYTSAEIDVLVVCLVPIDAWYVIPVERIQKASLLSYPYGGGVYERYEQYREAWSLMAPQTSGASFLSGCPENGRVRPGYLNPRFL